MEILITARIDESPRANWRNVLTGMDAGQGLQPGDRADHLQRDGAGDRCRDTFTKGRDFAAWLGLVSKQFSTGDRTVHGKISKRGNRYLRVLFVQAAWGVLIRSKNWERYALKPWIEAAKRRLRRNVLAVALANNLARIAWSVLAHGRSFTAGKLVEAATLPAWSFGARRSSP